MTRARSFFWCAAVLTAALSACSKLAEEPAAAQASERSRDFVQLDPKSPRLDFIKVEVVEESDSSGKVTLPGRVTFDEDHTQRVASPIDGRVVGMLVKLGDTVKAGQSLLQLSSPDVGQIQSDAQKALTDLSISREGDRTPPQAAGDRRGIGEGRRPGRG